jgi:hypothetical protein
MLQSSYVLRVTVVITLHAGAFSSSRGAAAGLPCALLQLRFRGAVLSREGDWGEFLACADHLVLEHFGEDGRLFKEDPHVQEAHVLTLTKLLVSESARPVPMDILCMNKIPSLTTAI